MRRLLGSVLVVLVLAACGGDAGDVAQPDAPVGGTDAPAQTAEGGSLDFTAPTIDGGQLDASSLEGRDVVLWFWAPW
jgi:hypothetical protein